MFSKVDQAAQADKIVYVKSVSIEDLPEEVQAQAGDAKTLYAVCNTDGERLALVSDRRMAFVLARQNDMAPVQVH